MTRLWQSWGPQARFVVIGTIGCLLLAAAILKTSRRRRLPLPADVSDGILVTCNRDLQKALLLIARFKSGLKLITAATITSLDYSGMNLCVTVSLEAEPRNIRIDFDRGLREAKDVGVRIADLYKAAAEALGETVDPEIEALLRTDPVKDTDYGLARKGFGSKELAGTVKQYSTHLFLMCGRATEWPKNVEDASDDSLSLARALSTALDENKKQLPGKVRLNLCECVADDEEGSLLVFPQEVLIKGVTSENASAVVSAFLVQGSLSAVAALPGVSVTTNVPRAHLFVCAHMKRDRRCGVIGPFLARQLRAVIQEKGLNVPVRACSHVGGHAYAGNVLAFSRRDEDGTVMGDWYGYVSGAVARDIVERHVVKGEVLRHVWRGRMGMAEEEQKLFARADPCADCQCMKTDL